jgi:hypothetical protein
MAIAAGRMPARSIETVQELNVSRVNDATLLARANEKG